MYIRLICYTSQIYVGFRRVLLSIYKAQVHVFEVGDRTAWCLLYCICPRDALGFKIAVSFIILRIEFGEYHYHGNCQESISDDPADGIEHSWDHHCQYRTPRKS